MRRPFSKVICLGKVVGVDENGAVWFVHRHRGAPGAILKKLFGWRIRR